MMKKEKNNPTDLADKSNHTDNKSNHTDNKSNHTGFLELENQKHISLLKSLNMYPTQW